MMHIWNLLRVVDKKTHFFMNMQLVMLFLNTNSLKH